ncbi:MAG: MFS transporter [Planctomycetes bacterium]|nr:MFS transporter [Planctomycetota bacterium]
MQAGELDVSARPTRVRWLVFGLACAASWLLYLHRYAWGIIRPEFASENRDLDAVDLGWLDSAFLATYAIGQIPGGMAGDRFGPRAMLSVLALVWSLAAVGVAWTSGFWPLVAARGVFGLAQAGVYPVLSKMTRTWFPIGTRTSVQGAVTAMGRLGAAFAPVVIAAFLMGIVGLSWQVALLVLSAPGLLLAVGFWFVVRDNPRQHPWTNPAEQFLVDPRVETTAIRAGEPPLQIVPRPALTFTAASVFSLTMLLLYTFLSTFQDQFFVNWLPSFLQDEKGFDKITMGLYAPLPFIGGAIGGVVGGVLNDVLIRQLGSRRWARSLVAFTGKFVAAWLVVLSVQMEDGRVTMMVLLAVRVFSDWSLPTQWAAVTDMGGRAGATLFGIVNTVGIAGGFIAGPLFGMLKKEYGYDGLFYGVAVLCAAAAVVWLFVDCTKRVVED